MRILSITAQKPHSTGSGVYLTEIVKALSRSGHEQAVIAGIYETDTACFPDNVAFHPVYFNDDFKIAGMSDVMPYPSQLYSRMTEADVSRFASLWEPVVKRVVEEFDPDIIFCHHLFLLTSMVRAWFPDRIIYGLSHGSDLRQFRQSEKLQDLVRPGIATLDRVYALHDEQVKLISELHGILEADIYVAGSGYNSDIFNDSGRTSSESGKLTISYAGKLSRAKGIEELMEAGRLLAADESFPEFEMVMAGGCQEPAILEAIREPWVSYLGMLNQRELAEVLRGSEVFVLPSYYEGLPLVLMEAMACGAVPVCTDLPGVKDWITASIPYSTAIFVPRPEMAGVDEPAEEAKPIFARQLADCIRQACERARLLGSGQLAEPETEAASWSACAERIFG